ncbi:hypothetical protein [Planctomycetes bacterium K23_9]|uniref:Uncharacterized protein n=1 Tax=Stieleria marina TaxID=1930275 RepID=A0A517NX72_9BACT|nr:hypothetical protein K239x_37370 [Planctomycetes bacterium K23_9]
MNKKPESALDADAANSQPTVIAIENEKKQPSRMKRAFIVSLVAHALLLVALLFWYLPSRSSAPAVSSGSKSSASPADDRAAPMPPPELMTPKLGDDVPAEQIRKSIDSQIEAVKKLPVEVKLSELDKNLKRLKSFANEKSVEQITEKIGSTLGLDTDQYQAKTEVPEGRFDFNTAQLSDVVRRKGPSGQWIYDATMVDAAGRTSNVEMNAADGATMHDLFSKMKKYPMAAGIYRSVVMPMLQKMIEAEKVAKKAAREAQRIQNEENKQ